MSFYGGPLGGCVLKGIVITAMLRLKPRMSSQIQQLFKYRVGRTERAINRHHHPSASLLTRQKMKTCRPADSRLDSVCVFWWYRAERAAWFWMGKLTFSQYCLTHTHRKLPLSHAWSPHLLTEKTHIHRHTHNLSWTHHSHTHTHGVLTQAQLSVDH